MSRDFYKYIATRIVEFFRQESENMHNGDRFCLKLDNYEMVAEVNNALIEETASHSIQGTFVLSDTYKTYTIKLSEREIVVAAQIGNMTDDFFATLRNLTLDINPNPILMISCSPIDTITSATRDMSAKGMPFHADALIETIDRDIKASSSLASDDAYLLSHELNRVKRDRFADKKSLFEYKSFLSSLRRGTVEQDDWIDFRLLPDNFSTVPESKRGERINSNHDDFETIDRAFRYGNIRDALGGDYDNVLINELETKKRNGRPWHETLDYAKLLLSKAKKERKQNNPLNIEDEDISAYYDNPTEQEMIR
jgi:DNA phosphorothioation-dependent restriction protein DptH